MKKFLEPVLLSLTILAAWGCAREVESVDVASCINPKQVDPDRMCPMNYAPVCGCNRKTYSNACVAGAAGVTRLTPGACEANASGRDD